MNINNAFPSNWIKADDLDGQEFELIMDKVVMEEIEDSKELPVLYFTGRAKGLVLNRTNSGTIADAYGEETNNWAGKPVVIFPAKTEYKGKRVDCIRVRVPAPKADTQAPTSGKAKF